MVNLSEKLVHNVVRRFSNYIYIMGLVQSNALMPLSYSDIFNSIKDSPTAKVDFRILQFLFYFFFLFLEALVACNNFYYLIMPPTSKKLEGHIASGLRTLFDA